MYSNNKNKTISLINILGLLKNFNPFGIDIASGVETEGKKDPEKIKRIVKLSKENS